MLCPRCGISVGDVPQLCPKCKPIEEESRAVREFARRQEQIKARKEESRRNLLRLIGGGVVLTCGLFLAAKVALTKREIPHIELHAKAGVQREICPYSEYCVVMYLTPWCPSCQGVGTEVKEISEYLSRSPKIDFELVLGISDLNGLNAFAKRFNVEPLFDPDGSLYRAAGVSGVPALFSVNRQRQVLGYARPWHTGSVEQRMKALLDELNLSF
ncbi:MAG: hypothetical protein IT291_00470 [Deltaproteobacteria bacterium]|nr:hypothetical protein [Deltaproteobacteria bacterium]